MTTVSYEPRMGLIRAVLAPDTWPAEVHSGPEGRSAAVRLTRLEATRLMEQLENAIRHADRAEAIRSAGAILASTGKQKAAFHS
jgi:hypothetical protein